MIVEEMEGEGVQKSDAALSNEAQVEPMEKKGKFEVSSLQQLFPFSSKNQSSALKPTTHNPQPQLCGPLLLPLTPWADTLRTFSLDK